MASILIVAHAPLASSLQALARHAYAECGRVVAAVDLPASVDLQGAQALVQDALDGLPGPEVLILADVFGATPCNAALSVADGVRSRVVAGLNVPMLWRTLCYSQLPLNELVDRAVEGGRQGIVPVATPRPQNRTNPKPDDDPDANPDQQ